jgi:hypothetical protein
MGLFAPHGLVRPHGLARTAWTVPSASAARLSQKSRPYVIKLSTRANKTVKRSMNPGPQIELLAPVDGLEILQIHCAVNRYLRLGVAKI